MQVYEAVNLDRVNGRVLGHARDGLKRACGGVSYKGVAGRSSARHGCARAGRAAHLVARVDSNGKLGLGEEVPDVGRVLRVGLELVGGVLVYSEPWRKLSLSSVVFKRLPSELTAGFNVTKNA